MNTTRQNAIRLRKKRKLSQAELAEIAGVEQPTISRFEKGSDNITLRVTTQIAKALGVETHELLLSSDRSSDEEILLSVFRTLSDDRRKGWMDMVQAAIDHSQSTT